MLLAQQDPLGEQAGIPTMGPPGTPWGGLDPTKNTLGGQQGGGQSGFGGKLGEALNSPLGVLGMNLLAQSGPSLTPQNFASGVGMAGLRFASGVGMAGLRTANQLNAQQKMALDREFIEASIGLKKAQTLGALGGGEKPKASTDRGKAIQDYNAGLIDGDALAARLGEIESAERRNVNQSASTLRAERDKTIAPISAGLQSIRAAEALLNSNNPFGDVASLTSFIKSVDNSVVRPSEMDAYNASVGLLNQIESIYQRAKGDGVLTPASREALRKSLQGLRENYQQILAGQDEFYKSEAAASGVDPSRVLRGVDPGSAGRSGQIVKPPDLPDEVWEEMTEDEREAFRE
jgi:hypothetical protein